MAVTTPTAPRPLSVDADLQGGDFNITAGGDLALIADTALVQEQLYRRLYDQPGALLFELDRGAGLSSFIGEPVSPTQLGIIEQTVATECLKHPAVSSVVSVTAQMQDPTTLVVVPVVTLVGRDDPTALPVVVTNRQRPPGPQFATVTHRVPFLWGFSVWGAAVWGSGE